MNNNYDIARAWVADECPRLRIESREDLEAARTIHRAACELMRAEGTSSGVDAGRLNELESDIGYAGDRHWTFQWKIIAGAILSVVLLYWWSGSKEEDVAAQKAKVGMVEAWQKGDTIVAIEAFKGGAELFSWDNRLQSAPLYKGYKLQLKARDYYGVQYNIDSYLRDAQITSDPEKKERYLKKAEEYKAKQPENEKKYLDEYNEIAAMDFEAIRDMALQETGARLKAEEGSRGTVNFWFWFLVICTPLYIFACRPYGYSLTRHAAEAETLNAIHRFGMWASGGLVGASAALHFTTIITKWSDGTTTKSDDGMGPVIGVLKILLIVAAVIVFCFTCCVIMAYATVTGLIRNYDWKAIFGRLSGKAPAASPAAAS